MQIKDRVKERTKRMLMTVVLIVRKRREVREVNERIARIEFSVEGLLELQQPRADPSRRKLPPASHGGANWPGHTVQSAIANLEVSLPF